MREYMCKIPLTFETDDGAIIVWANGSAESREIIDVVNIDVHSPNHMSHTVATLVDRYGLDRSDAADLTWESVASGNGNHSQEAAQLDTNARA